MANGKVSTGISSNMEASSKIGKASTTSTIASFDAMGSIVPFCMATLSPAAIPAAATASGCGSGNNPAGGNACGYYSVTQANQLFEDFISPLFKLKGSNFFELVSSEEHQLKLKEAIACVISGQSSSKKARNIEMTTLADSNSGLPIRRHCDWTIVKGQEDEQLLLFGDPVTEHDAEQRAKDADLVDFFQKAPIALHWLSGEGIVLWANQRELDVLGYTAKEYIGQPIMNFCPDEEDIVLEIFKQLGSGNAIRDVPVRFRTKGGKIVNLLIDSNVKYDDAGKFEHTRCFIRDDTPRKIREAQAQLLLDETKRSLRMLDNFMSRSMHHMRTPLHVLQTSMDIVSNDLANISKSIQQGNADTATSLVNESQKILNQAGNHVLQAVDMIDDITDLARLDQGQELKIRHEPIDLKKFGRGVFAGITVPPNVEVSLEFTSGGPPRIFSDKINLKKVIRHLLEHLLSEAQGHKERNVSLIIGHTADRVNFTVIDSGVRFLSPVSDVQSRPAKKSTIERSLPLIFQRYHQELLPENIIDLDTAGNLRQKIETGINNHRINSIGIGLPLSHHLVRALGGDLRYSARAAATTFWFSLPLMDKKLEPERIIVETAKVTEPSNKRARFMKVKEASLRKIIPEHIASCGLKALDTISVLVVEDVPMCAKLMCNLLRHLDCSPTWAENGQVALDLLKEDLDQPIFDLILMDLRMPVMDGLVATKLIKDDLKLKIPIVALTGDTATDFQEECQKVGFDEFCRKPLRRQELIKLIEKHTNIAG